MCQSLGMPPSAEYWHIGATKMRFLSSSSRSLRGVKSLLMTLPCNNRNAANPGAPFSRAAVVYRVSLAVDRDRDRHILDFKFVNGFHPQIGKGDDPGGLDRLGDQIRRAADGDQVHRAMVTNGGDGRVPTFCFADHAQQAGFLQH